MIKGQLSIDFMLTVVAVLIFTQLFLTFSNNYLENATELNIRQQEKLIALQIASIINEIDTLSDTFVGDKTIVQYNIPWIYEGNKPAGQDCNITMILAPNKITPAQIKIDYARNSKIITTIQKVPIIPLKGMKYEEMTIDANKFFCGGKLKYESVIA